MSNPKEHATSAGSVWKCEACKQLVKGIDWGKAAKGDQFHTTPSGAGECRAVNFTKVEATAENTAKAVKSRSSDDTDDHKPLGTK